MRYSFTPDLNGGGTFPLDLTIKFGAGTSFLAGFDATLDGVPFTKPADFVVNPFDTVTLSHPAISAFGVLYLSIFNVSVGSPTMNIESVYLGVNCVAEGTQVDTALGSVAVQDLRAGDLVRVRRYAVHAERQGITAASFLPVAEVLASRTSGPITRIPAFLLAPNGRDVLVTGAHPLLVGGNFYDAAGFAPGRGAEASNSVAFQSWKGPANVHATACSVEHYAGGVYNLRFDEECAFSVAGGLYLAAEFPRPKGDGALTEGNALLARTHMPDAKWYRDDGSVWKQGPGAAHRWVPFEA